MNINSKKHDFHYYAVNNTLVTVKNMIKDRTKKRLMREESSE